MVCCWCIELSAQAFGRCLHSGQQGRVGSGRGLPGLLEAWDLPRPQHTAGPERWDRQPALVALLHHAWLRLVTCLTRAAAIWVFQRCQRARAGWLFCLPGPAVCQLLAFPPPPWGSAGTSHCLSAQKQPGLDEWEGRQLCCLTELF